MTSSNSSDSESSSRRETPLTAAALGFPFVLAAALFPAFLEKSSLRAAFSALGLRVGEDDVAFL
jgi:hypothetical protein